jgi:hypothetical protein
MKAYTQTVILPIEIQNIPGFTLALSVSARKEMLASLEAIGIGPTEIGNHITKLLQEAVDACDGSVSGLIVSNRESI